MTYYKMLLRSISVRNNSYCCGNGCVVCPQDINLLQNISEPRSRNLLDLVPNKRINVETLGYVELIAISPSTVKEEKTGDSLITDAAQSLYIRETKLANDTIIIKRLMRDQNWLPLKQINMILEVSMHQSITDQCINYFNLLEVDESRNDALITSHNENIKRCFKIDIYNLLDFYRLCNVKSDVCKYAQAIYKFVQHVFPYTCSAFENYVLNSITFSQREASSIVQNRNLLTSRQEKASFKRKLKKLGLLNKVKF